ncbi:poly-beta-1,6 N-acetyl-D-glucosamine export porin PgaA [Lysobacter silvisoli]|uniref:Poly-beta-1,6 N-acetyl-D-glucosamine export porin PgaA n=1 Tax=Lysobacter silvisoli TaxID=2293254 RepID=A0A371K2G5_9GAMM|nr:poly-beta-1,6 N-acetyl-D-glucosamine export porin PgaA [Lysobacter silvisoli]RDZ28074.1 poly-beta-1,6 N-acetyl-D-glucosamine export porin PgaA [Lysobacter silvisoli]
MLSLHRLTRSVAWVLAAGTLHIASVAAAEGHPAPATDYPRIEQLRTQRDWLGALAAIEQQLAAHPQDDRLYRLRVLTLADIGSRDRARQLYLARPQLFSAEEAAVLDAAGLARRIVWSKLYAVDEATRQEEARAADAAIDAYRAQLARNGQAEPASLAYDRLIVLNRLGRHAEVASEYRRLETGGTPVPGYALGAVGDSLLALRRPDEAAAALQRAVQADPDDPDLPIQLAYAELERERFDRALPLLRSLMESRPTWPRAPGARRGHENWPRYDAETNYALARAFGEDLPGAQAMLEPLAAIGPNNADLQANLGSVYQLRGWTERALERYRIAATLDERNVEARIGQVETLSLLQRYDQARPIHDELLARYPNEPHVRTMERTWAMRRGWQARAFVSGGRNRDDGGGASASPLGNRDREYGLEVATPLMDDRWRIFARSGERWADFQGDRSRAQRNEAGVSYAYGRLSANAYVGRDRDGLGGTAFGVGADWRIDDRYALRARAARNDAGASLQARAAGITADLIEVGADYRPSERTAVGATLQHWRYDDGNRRDQFSASLDQRLLSRPHLLIDGLARAGAGRGSRDDAPYFNPSRDASAEFGLRLDRLTWRRYDRHFRQRLTATVGPYWQQDYGTAWVPSLRYEHEWQFALGRVLSYGLSWSRPVYDGRREDRLGFDAELRWGE